MYTDFSLCVNHATQTVTGIFTQQKCMKRAIFLDTEKSIQLSRRFITHVCISTTEYSCRCWLTITPQWHAKTISTCVLVKDKRDAIWLSGTSMIQESQNCKGQGTSDYMYTTVADLHRAASWNNRSHPTSVVYRVKGVNLPIHCKKNCNKTKTGNTRKKGLQVRSEWNNFKLNWTNKYLLFSS